MKFLILENEQEDAGRGYDMFLSLRENADGEMTLYAYPSANSEVDDETVLLIFRDDGLHLQDCIDISGWPTDKNGYIKIIRDK